VHFNSYISWLGNFLNMQRPGTAV